MADVNLPGLPSWARQKQMCEAWDKFELITMEARSVIHGRGRVH